MPRGAPATPVTASRRASGTVTGPIQRSVLRESEFPPRERGEHLGKKKKKNTNYEEILLNKMAIHSF